MDRAEDVYDEVQLKMTNVESFELKKTRLINEYQSIAMTRFTYTERTLLVYVLQEIVIYKSASALARLENVILLPKRVKALSAEVDGVALRAFFQARSYDPTISTFIYSYISTFATCAKYGVPCFVNAPYLVGPPGTGKTFLVEEMARALQLPFISISLTTGNFHEELFGCHRYNEHPGGKLVQFITHQPGRTENIYPVIIFFDEVDKLLDNTLEQATLRQFFYGILNNNSGSRVIASPALGGLELDLSRCIIILGGNKLIDSKAANTGGNIENNTMLDQAFNSRVSPLTFPSVSKENKLSIGLTMMKELAERCGHVVSDETETRVKEAIETNEDPGVRTLKSTIQTIVLDDWAKEDGW